MPFLVPWLLVAGFLMAWLGVDRFGVLRLLLALRLELVDAPLRLDHRRIDVCRRGRVAPLATVAIATTTASPAAALLVTTVALAFRTRIAGIRARMLELRLGFDFHGRLRLLRLLWLLRARLLPLLRTLSFRTRTAVGAIRTRTTIGPAVVALTVALTIALPVVSLAIARRPAVARLAITALLQSALLLAIAILVASATVTATVTAAVAATIAAPIATIAAVTPLLAMVALLVLRPRGRVWCDDRGWRRLRRAEQAAE